MNAIVAFYQGNAIENFTVTLHMLHIINTKLQSRRIAVQPEMRSAPDATEVGNLPDQGRLNDPKVPNRPALKPSEATLFRVPFPPLFIAESVQQFASQCHPPCQPGPNRAVHQNARER